MGDPHRYLATCATHFIVELPQVRGTPYVELVKLIGTNGFAFSFQVNLTDNGKILRDALYYYFVGKLIFGMKECENTEMSDEKV